MSKFCTNCNTENVHEAKFCKKCGLALTIDSLDDEKIYDQIADEFSKNIRKEGLWLKAFQEADGDDNKTKALYIKYRSESIKKDFEKIREEERLNLQILLEKNENETKLKVEKLSVFLYKNNMVFNKKISDIKVKANVIGNLYDSYLEYENEEWKIVNRVLNTD